MTDRVYLSIWLRGHTQFNMIQSLERALERFPVSHLDRSAVLRIYALEMVEPPMSEQHFEDASVTDITQFAREFENPDCAYDVEVHWDLWQRQDTWQLLPAPVRITCFAPKFPSDLGEQMLIDLGFEYLYLPEQEGRPNWTALRSNIRSLVRFASELEEMLPISKRTLWSDSGDDFSERIEEALEESRVD